MALVPLVCWVQYTISKRSNLKLTIEVKSFEGLIDTGADVTMIRGHDWPTSWPLSEMLTHLQGIFYPNNPKYSAKLLTWKDEEENSGKIQPYVMPNLPTTLWGRDLLSQIGLIMCSPNECLSKFLNKDICLARG